MRDAAAASAADEGAGWLASLLQCRVDGRCGGSSQQHDMTTTAIHQ